MEGKKPTAKRQLTLKDILFNHCQDASRPNGLLLLTLPTGFGKTYYVLEYMAEHIRQKLPQRVWFITNLKKNLPVEELKQRVGEDLFNREVLLLSSYSDQVLHFLKHHDIPDSVKGNFRTFEPLRKAAEALRNAPAHPEFKQYLQEQLSLKELVFRKELKGFLKPYFQGATSFEERLRVLRATPELRWVEILYPSVQFFEKKAFFCTIDKFYLYVDTVIGPNIQITNPKYIGGNMVFIDEFDATKQNIKRAIIENAIRFNQDILGLFIQIFYGVQSRKLPVSRINRAARKRLDYLKGKFDKLTEEAWRIYSEYQFQSHFYHKGTDGANRAFLFHDFEYHTVFEGGEKGKKPGFLARHYDKDDLVNYIRIEHGRPETDNKNLLFLLNDLRSFIHLFSFFVLDFARKYKELHDEVNPEEISIENAIRTTLDLFDLHDTTTQRYFIGHISQLVLVNQDNASTGFDLSPVNQGFRYYDILNRKTHDATSKVMYADTLTTPETWLLNLCQHAKVVGISATAGFDSPISNYSLSHLRHHLQGRFFELTPTEQAVLREEFLLKNSHGDQREIRPVGIRCSVNKRHALEELFTDKEIVLQFLHQFHSLQEFEVQRYVKVGKAYLHFIRHPEIYSFLCLLNKFPRSGAFDRFREQDLKELFAQLRVQYLEEEEPEARKAVEAEARIVDSQGFEEKLEDINRQLTEGGRIFLISTYQTMGAGQNIQYDAPEGVELVAINGLGYGGRKKDYDALFLEKPTYLLQYFPDGEDISDEQLLDYLFEVEYLAEGGAISRKEKRERIRYAFRRRFNPHLRAPGNKELYERKAVAEHFCRLLIQAAGRLSRTRLKAPVTHLLFDDAIRDYLQFFQASGYLLVPEFEALLQYCQKPAPAPALPSYAEEVMNQNLHRSLAFSALLHQLTRGIPNWRPETIRFWEVLREFVLKNPTIDRERLQRSGMQKFYITHPEGNPASRYYYRSEDDFRSKLLISFDENMGKEASDAAALLPELLQIPLIADLFREKGYAASFEPREFILSPPLFQNIYLGALGETIGEKILRFYGMDCRPLEQGEYELFDARVSERLYVDFKFWGAHTRVAAQEQKEKIRRKMAQANVQRVLIVNIVSPGGRFEPIPGDDGIVEVPGLVDARRGIILQPAIQFIHHYISEYA
ncbi:MAG: hypothetical protein H6556_28105 [Lewinellaceae bacterium]|nr:hypothetical protein [Lewinellaceae bacterium]